MWFEAPMLAVFLAPWSMIWADWGPFRHPGRHVDDPWVQGVTRQDTLDSRTRFSPLFLDLRVLLESSLGQVLSFVSDLLALNRSIGSRVVIFKI